GADLRLINDRTIAVIPHGAEAAKDGEGKPLPYTRLHLVFAADGRLAERQVVEMPSGKIYQREVCSADGTVKWLDADGKEWALQKGSLKACPAPNLKPDVSNLIVLSLPFRSPEHVLQTRKIKNTPLEQLRFADALALFAAYVAADQGNEAKKVF